MTPRELLDACDTWNAQAAEAMGKLNATRAAILKDAKRLKMSATVKALLVAPKIGGEPVASEAPAAYPQAEPEADPLKVPAFLEREPERKK